MPSTTATAALLAHSGLVAVALKVLVVGVVIGMARAGFRWLPRTTLLFVCMCSAIIGAALASNVVQLVSQAQAR
jgi:hypothetical protein